MPHNPGKYPFRLKSRYGQTVARFSSVQAALAKMSLLTFSPAVPDVTHYRVTHAGSDKIIAYADYNAELSTWTTTIRRSALWDAEGTKTRSSEPASPSRAV